MTQGSGPVEWVFLTYALQTFGRPAGQIAVMQHQLVEEKRRVGKRALHHPVLSSWDPTAFVITGIALALIFWRKWPTTCTLGICAVLGLATPLLG